MTPANIVLLVNVALDLAERAAKALALAKRGDVTDEEVAQFAADDDAARDALQAEIDRRNG